jgi:hypothetical protein
MDVVDDVQSDLEAAVSERDYTAVNTLWLGLLKLANLEEGKTEFDRLVAIVNRIPEEKVQAIVGALAVDALLNLEPPLETVVSHPRERLDTGKVSAALDQVRNHRTCSPREALAGLGFVLKAIRNKREHGFKTRLGPRDTEVLAPARQLLDQLCRAALEAVAAA